jgi:hypothetical protein
VFILVILLRDAVASPRRGSASSAQLRLRTELSRVLKTKGCQHVEAGEVRKKLALCRNTSS